MLTVYGIKNCDTVKKTLKWLADNGIQAKLHDYRVDGLTPTLLTELEDLFGWENLINKRSTTWRTLDETRKTLDKTSALTLLAEYPTLIKRPIVLGEDVQLIGFNQTQYTAALLK
ncbi:arsenate reductase [Mergibacter septicus]|uniref:Spx/MgsR family RNA polymerase-binding regulatory protein n=1 Tax=Mergibacter septicus TaxID=221402 RepID=UPI00117966AF|nr:Spx/MgsR family RNA polymerase-binding regulatory protein [Mergibacter septicus]AWX13599.1 arsenate reductase [Mergibacter septicus]QDJ13024.1 arsenate reductase [Mergibacter septicus]